MILDTSAKRITAQVFNPDFAAGSFYAHISETNCRLSNLDNGWYALMRHDDTSFRVLAKLGWEPVNQNLPWSRGEITSIPVSTDLKPASQEHYIIQAYAADEGTLNLLKTVLKQAYNVRRIEKESEIRIKALRNVNVRLIPPKATPQAPEAARKSPFVQFGPEVAIRLDEIVSITAGGNIEVDGEQHPRAIVYYSVTKNRFSGDEIKTAMPKISIDHALQMLREVRVRRINAATQDSAEELPVYATPEDIAAAELRLGLSR